jgi:hypothetical protein
MPRLECLKFTPVYDRVQVDVNTTLSLRNVENYHNLRKLVLDAPDLSEPHFHFPFERVSLEHLPLLEVLDLNVASVPGADRENSPLVDLVRTALTLAPNLHTLCGLQSSEVHGLDVLDHLRHESDLVKRLILTATPDDDDREVPVAISLVDDVPDALQTVLAIAGHIPEVFLGFLDHFGVLDAEQKKALFAFLHAMPADNPLHGNFEILLATLAKTLSGRPDREAKLEFKADFLKLSGSGKYNVKDAVKRKVVRQRLEDVFYEFGGDLSLNDYGASNLRVFFFFFFFFFWLITSPFIFLN